jgi:hypothetical protein
MTKNEQLKDSISNAFECKDFSLAFYKLLTLEHYEIFHYLAENNSLNDNDIANYFWNNYCLNNFNLVFTNKACETFLNWYVKDFKKTNDFLNKKLVLHYSDAFLNAIKRNRVFLKNQFLLQIQQFDWSTKFNKELEAMKTLQKGHVELQNEIENAWKEIEHEDIFKILCVLVYWVDGHFFSNYSNLYHEELRRVFDYTVSFIDSKERQIQGISEEQFSKLFIQSINQNQKIESLFEKIQKWVRFNSILLTNYCFQPNDYLEKNNDRNNDARRYEVNEKRYYFQAKEKYNNHIKEYGIDQEALKIEKNEKLVHLQYLQNWKTKLILDDLMLDDVLFKRKTSSYFRLIQGLTLLSTSRNLLYSDPMKKIIGNGFTWYDGYKYIFQNAVKNNTEIPLPYFYHKKDYFISTYVKQLENITQKETSDIVNHFAFQFSSKNIFNPFHQSYNVMETPFIKIGEYMFSPVCFLGKNRWFYSATQKALTIYSNNFHVEERKKSSFEMEKFLAYAFELQGFNSKVINAKESSSIDGDIDLFINDGESQILIQLKRTRFKLDLAADYKEHMEVDLKASCQINTAITSLKENKELGIEIYENPNNWIVTTSFEGLLTEVDGCLKVNYFDLLWALRHIKFNSLADLVKYMEEDRPFKDCMHYLEIQE